MLLKVSFVHFGPIAINEAAELSGWTVQLRPAVTVYYGALKLQRPVSQILMEPTPGLVLYLPDSGVTTASAPGTSEQFRIVPGQAYCYSSEAGPYTTDMQEAGCYSGLKLFFGAEVLADIPVQAVRQYCKDPAKLIFSEIPVSQDLLVRIAQLPSASPEKLPNELELLSTLNQIVADMLSLWLQIESTNGETDSIADVQISAADQYLKTHLSEPPSVLVLANLVGLNHMTMKRGFRRHYGTSIYGRLRFWRMQRAAELLRAGASVTESALEVGYANPSKFAAAFRRETGRNPSDI